VWGVLFLAAAACGPAFPATLEWGTYLGGSGGDGAQSVALDGDGNLYVVGDTASTGWVSGGWDATFNDGVTTETDAFLVKLSPAGAHVWSTYLGGSGKESGSGVAVDGSGNVYATGETYSAGWTSGGWDTTINEGTAGLSDGYVVKLTPAGSHAWSTYLGAIHSDYGYDIAVDGSGNVYATGETYSAGWTSDGWDTTINGGSGGYPDGYVVKLTPAGAHAWSTYLGGTADDSGYGIAVDGDGNVCATGKTTSYVTGWVSGGWNTTANGTSDGFVVKLAPAGMHVWSTYLGGLGVEYGRDIAVDGSGNAYVTGDTDSAGWTSGGWDTTWNGDKDGYVVKLTPAGAHAWSTYLGGTAYDYGYGIAVDGGGNVYTTGSTRSAGWTSGGWDTIWNGTYDGFVVKLTPAGAHAWSTYLGGASGESGLGIAVDGSGNVYVTGQTNSAGWISGGWDTTHNGSSDAYVVKIVDTGETGSLQMTLAPPAAVAAGAQWRPTTTTAWLNSGDTVSGLAAGEWSVEFKDIAGWTPPGPRAVSVPTGGTAADTGVYTSVSVDMAWSTYLGGTAYDYGYGIAVDGSGNVYATGTTSSTGWTSGGWDATDNGTDGFVVKLTSGGAHQWSTYLGGANPENGCGIAVDGSGNVYATGTTSSAGWTSGGWDTTYSGTDGYVVKLTPAGAHAWSTYLGGAAYDYGYGIAVDGSGNVYATGTTSSTGWTSGGWDTTGSGGYDGFVVKLTPTGAHAWSTYLGGLYDEYGQGIAVDEGGGNVYATGSTGSSGWISGGWKASWNGGTDGYVVKLTEAGAHAWSTYLGGGGDDEGYGIAVDGGGNVYAAGETKSAWWTSGGWDTMINGGAEGVSDGYVVKLTPAGAHAWSTYLGGLDSEYVRHIAVDGSGNVYATGDTDSAGWTSGGWDTSWNGGTDSYVVKLTPAGAHIWSAYLGGEADDEGYGIAVDGSGNVYAAGSTSSAWWTNGGWDTTYDGFSDAYVAKMVDTGETGSLQITLAPPAAAVAGAQWRPTTTTAWLNSGDTASGLAAGEWRVEFKDAAGWAPPGSHTVIVPAEGTAADTGVYTSVAVDMTWSTYLGGTGDDRGTGIAVDGSGNVYATGQTQSAGWTSGGGDATQNGGWDGYVVKLTSAGAHQWSTYLGGASAEYSQGIAVDGSGTVYVTGCTYSAGWTSGGGDTTYNGGWDGYVVKLTPAGAHAWSTYLGGTNAEYGESIAVDGDGSAYATGYTTSAGWTSGGWDTTQSGGWDAYVVKLTPAGAHAWSTYLGGTGDEYGYGIAVDGSGNVHANGHTGSPGWTSGGWDTTINGGYDGFVVKLTPAGSHVWSTYLGGASSDQGRGIAVDGSGNVYATGQTQSAGWTSGGGDMTQNGGWDGYVVTLTPAGAHAWSTYLGGAKDDWGYGISVDGSGNVYVTGQTQSAGWTSGGGDTTQNGGYDAYVVKFTPTGAHAWSTCLGGEADDEGYGIAVDGSGNVYATGYTQSADWVFGGWQTAYGGNTDAFVVKIIGFVAPDAPSDSGAAAIGLDTITWTWVDNSSDETGFNVWADPGAGAPVTLQATTAADATAWTQGGLPVNSLHTFQVAATNADGDSERTAPFPAWTLAAVPAAPVVGNPTGATLDLSVGAGDGNPAGTEYALRCVTTGQWVQADGALGGTAMWQAAAVWGTVTVSGLAEATEHTFEALARNGAGVETAAGPAASGVTLEAVPPTAMVTLLDPTPTQAAVLRYGVVFSEPVAPTFTVDDVALTGGLSGTVAVDGADPAYTVTVTLTGMNPDGLTGIAIGTDVQDGAGNGFAGAVSPQYDVVWWPGFAAPPAGGVLGYTGDPGPVLDASVAAGAPRAAAYQWWRDDGTKSVVAGPAMAVWNLGTLSPALDGVYWCSVAYGGLSVTTAPVEVRVRNRIALTAQPADQTIVPGGTAVFTVSAAGGYTPLHYQWRLNGANAPGSPDAAAWTLENVTAEQAGAYSVVVSDSHSDSAESGMAVLKVESNVPAAGMLGLAALAGALALAGRRRRGVRR